MTKLNWKNLSPGGDDVYLYLRDYSYMERRDIEFEAEDKYNYKPIKE